MPRTKASSPSADAAPPKSETAPIREAAGAAESAKPETPSPGVRPWDNKGLAEAFYETAELMEINGDDAFRVRSYRRAAEAIEALTEQVSDLMAEPKKLLEVPGIGKGMAAHLQQMFRDGHLQMHTELLEKYRPSMLQLLKIQGLGPKTIALLWSTYKVCDLEGVEKLAREGRLRILPRMGEKHEQKILKAIEDYRRISGRFLLDDADRTAQRLVAQLADLTGIDKITPAGSLRRGQETVGDLDLLITGDCCSDPQQRAAVLERVVKLPGIADVLAQGDNKVSFRLRSGMQVDVRLLPRESYGAALQYFTGSKAHNIALRQRAMKMGYTLNEYALTRVDNGEFVAGQTEEAIYDRLGLDFIAPELRENCGEIQAAETHTLPKLVNQADIRADLHMHTVETDGRCTLLEMAEAARARGYEYIAVTEHSRNLAFANGLDDKRALAHAARIRAMNEQIEGIEVLAGIEVDILGDGSLDLSAEVLAQLDVVIASVHSRFQQSEVEMTERLVRAVSSPSVSWLGHPTGRLLLRREAYRFDMNAVLEAAAANGVAMELNAYPDRLDLCDRHLRQAREHGVKIAINTDSHHTSHLENMKYGVQQARRAWLTKDDVLNTLPLEAFRKAIRRG